jgi:AraC family transcriptional regulator
MRSFSTSTSLSLTVTKKIYLKNMVCNRCILVVDQAFNATGIKPLKVNLGEVEIPNDTSEIKLRKVGEILETLGFELLDDSRKMLIEKIKSSLIKKVQSGEIEEHFKISDFLTNTLHKEYTSLSRLFSEVEGITIEHFFILQKIEKVKEWLAYGEQNLSEISYRLGYSNLAHLSAQFKKITGLTTSHFKKIGALHRQPLDKVGRN